jgi:hypothetical protein
MSAVAMMRSSILSRLPYNPTEKYLIFDRAANFNEEVVSTIQSFGIEPKRTPLAERSCRTLCGQLQERPARSHDRAKRATSSTRIVFWRGTATFLYTSMQLQKADALPVRGCAIRQGASWSRSNSYLDTGRWKRRNGISAPGRD